MNKDIKLNHAAHTLNFKDTTCKSVNICNALCCRHWDINLALEEYQTGIFKAESFCALDKTTCLHPKNPCPNRSYRLLKNQDRSCIYLNKKNRCSIHTTRPIVCRNYICEGGFKLEPVCTLDENINDDFEICSFEGVPSKKTKYLLNPYLKLKSLSKNDNTLVLVFKDITNCKDKKVELIGLDYFPEKKEMALLLKQFNGKSSPETIAKKRPRSLSKETFLNLTHYLTDEGILVGLFGRGLRNRD